MTSPFSNDAVKAVIREVAEEKILPHFRKLKKEEIRFKTANDPVTIADKGAETALKERLTSLIPGSIAVGEESYAENPRILDSLHKENYVWIIDPLDGTRNFVDGTDIFGVIVALSKQNQTVASWLYHPTSGEFIAAEKGAGAYYKGEKLQVLPPNSLGQMTGVFGFRIHEAYELLPQKQKDVMPRPIFAKPSLAACHDFPRLVLNRPHFGCDEETQWHFRSLLQTCTPWDDAAPLMIHAEAGGYARHWDGTPFAPTSFDRGFMAAPDKESWWELRNWIASFCKIPA